MIGVLVSGTGTNLQALLDAGLPVRAVASNREDAPALARAAHLPTATFALSAHPSREERDAAMADWLQSHGVELVVLAGYMHILTPAFLDRFPGRVVNVHPSLPSSPPALPRRGSPSTSSTKGSTRARCSCRSASRSIRATRSRRCTRG